jgi:hypothetical protein
MIRERVSTQGVIRPLEPEDELDAFHVAPDVIGVIGEVAARRYIDATTHFDKKFSGAIKAIEKDRRRNLERAKQDIYGHMAHLQAFLWGEEKDVKRKGIKEGLKAMSGSWGWAWALDGQERPPPSSIVSRRDTAEARRLARIADKSVMPDDECAMNGNSLWSIVVNFLSAAPEKNKLEVQRGKVEDKDHKSWFVKLKLKGEVAAEAGTGEVG